eukprot:162668_1
MEKLIQFRLLSSKLSLDEYRTAICNVVNDSNMEEFSCMIFNHFYQKLRKPDAEQILNELQINTINQEITNIISQRKLNQSAQLQHDETDDDESESHQPLNITDCADTLIQEIASFLSFRSYSHFECCCRSIFYAANSPCALYELPTTMNIQKYVNTEKRSDHEIQLRMKRFERVKVLTVTHQNNRYIALAQFRNVKHLDIEHRPSCSQVEQYLSNNTFNLETVTHLAVCSSASLEIIKRCTDLRILKLGGRYGFYHNSPRDDDDDDTSQLSQQLANLKCLSKLQGLVWGSGVRMDPRIVLKNICNTLQSLSIDQSIQGDKHDMEGLTFDGLVELCLITPSSTNILPIIEKTKRLERLRLRLLWDESGEPETESSYALAFGKIFELNTLQYLYIEYDNHTEISQLVLWIESSFHTKRNILKLEIVTDQYNPVAEIHKAMRTIWNALSTWCTSHFMLIWSFNTPQNVTNDNELPALNQWLDIISNTFSVDRVTDIINNDNYLYDKKIIISNK